MDLVWSDFTLGISMFSLMLGMGLTLHLDDFRRVALAPRASIIGTVVQLLILPILGIAIAEYFALPPLLSAGIVVLAACPGGMFSNVMVHFAKGNTALSVTLTATATLVTLFTLPLWIQFSATRFATTASGPLEMPILETALRLGALTILPIAIGMWIRARWPERASLERRLTLIGGIGIGISIFAQGAERPDLPIEEFRQSFAPAASFAFAAILTGLLVPLLFRVSARDAITIAVESVVKNTLLGMVLVGQVLEFEAIIPILAFGIFQMPSGILLLFGWRKLADRGILKDAEAAPHPFPRNVE